MTEIEQEMRRIRLRDELHAIGATNAYPHQDYEANVRHQAELNLRRSEILRELAW